MADDANSADPTGQVDGAVQLAGGATARLVVSLDVVKVR